MQSARILAQSDELESNDLLWAVGNDHVEMVKWLISMGADPNAEGGMAGETALIVAAEHGSTECVSVLLAVGADVHASDAFSHRAISRAANAEIVRLLADGGADLDYEDGEGYTLLKRVAEDGREDMVQTLLELGAAPDASRLNDTPLRVAVREDELEVVKLLLKAGADPNIRTLADDWYPLEDVKSAETLRVLLDAGADPSYKDQFGRKAVESHTDSEIVMMLEQAEQRASGRTGKAKSCKKRK